LNQISSKGFTIGVLLLPVLMLVVRWTTFGDEFRFQYDSRTTLETIVLNAYRWSCANVSPFCDHDQPNHPNLDRMLAGAFHTRDSLPLILTGFLASFQPHSAQTGMAAQIDMAETGAKYVHFGMDVIGAFLCVVMLRQCGLPKWTALLGGYLLGFYPPNFIESATIFREPVSRFALLLSLAGYIMALHARRRQFIISCIILASLGTLLLGFASTPNRLMIWLLFTAFIIAVLLHHNFAHRVLAICTQLLIAFAVIVGLYWYAPIASTLLDTPVNEIFPIMVSGINTGGGAVGLTTVTSCEEIWCSIDELYAPGFFSDTRSIAEHIMSNPLLFAQRYLYSMYGNMASPSNVFAHEVMLTIAQQTHVHHFLLVLGVLGFVWFVRDLQRFRAEMLLFIVPVLYWSVIFSINGIETRRFTTVIQIFILMSAVSIYGLYQLFLHNRRAFWRMMGATLACALIWSAPIAIPLMIASFEVQLVYNVLLVLRLIVVLVFLWYWIVIVVSSEPSGWRWLAVALLLPCGLLYVYGDHLNQNRYEWQAAIDDETLVQVMPGLTSDGAHWVLVDVASEVQATQLQISINDRIVKASGIAMVRYLLHETVVNLHLDNYREYRLWHGYLIDAEVLQRIGTTRPLIVTLESATPYTIFGSYAQEASLIAPGLHPSRDVSFSYLIYNNYDPRIKRSIDVSGISSHIGAYDLTTFDLSQAIGVQQGIFHVFLVPDTGLVEMSLEDG